MRISITGTPGTGKTAVSCMFKEKGYKVVDLNEFAKKNGFILGYDKERECYIIDIDKVDINLREELKNTDSLIFIDGHLSHLLSFLDKVIILRCHPKELRKRLENKGWKKDKIKENIEAEILDVILCEAAERHDQEELFEVDTTNLSVGEVTDIVESIVLGKYKKSDYSIGNIDWSNEILKAW